MRRLPHTAAEDLLEIVMRRYEKASTPRGRLGQAPGRYRRRRGTARPSAPPCPCPHLRPQKLAHPAAGRRAPGMRREPVKQRAVFGSGATFARGPLSGYPPKPTASAMIAGSCTAAANPVARGLLSRQERATTHPAVSARSYGRFALSTYGRI
jgi:hypothetical protein